jgi:hypothetical protein
MIISNSSTGTTEGLGGRGGTMNVKERETGMDLQRRGGAAIEEGVARDGTADPDLLKISDKD